MKSNKLKKTALKHATKNSNIPSANSPLVSIIAICHKHAPYVEETLESIRNQTYPHIELIIINNVKDECEGIIRRWIERYEVVCRFIQNKKPLSITQNLNLGLEYVSGEYFQGISCDDLLVENKIFLQVNLFRSSKKKVACVFGNIVKIDNNGDVIKGETEFERLKRIHNLTRIPNGRLINEISERPFIPAPTVLLKTDIVKRLNSYDENYPFEDWQMWIKLSYNGFEFIATDKVLVKYRILESSLGRNRDLFFHVSLIDMFKKYSAFLNRKAKGLRYQWIQSIGIVRQHKVSWFIKELLCYTYFTRDISPRTIYRLWLRVGFLGKTH